ncbi:MAG TPA: hypothetical protein VKA89_12580 [Solirubrobacterales bacterium]|nr:hypothetical protein [Solirubrobacterales bacterium]
MLKKAGAILLAAGALGLAACGDDDDDTTAASGGGETTAAASGGGAEPSVTFMAPKDGGTSPATVTAKVDVTGFKIDPKQVGMAKMAGEGHLHFSMDGGKFDYPKYSGANGKLAVQLGVDGKYSPAVAPTITYKGLPKGEHTLEVDLANNDHTDTGVTASTTFMVK